MTRRKKLPGEVCSLDFSPASQFVKCSGSLQPIKVYSGPGDSQTVVCARMWAVLRVGVHTQPGGMAQRLLEEQIGATRNFWARNERATMELEMERRSIVSAMRHRDPERGGLGPCMPPAASLPLCSVPNVG